MLFRSEKAQQARATRLRESASGLDVSLAEALALDLHQVVMLEDLLGVGGPARIGALGVRWDGATGLRLDLRLWRLSA